MHFEREKIGNVQVARITIDRITHEEAPDMKTSLLQLLMDKEENILINFENVSTMDSTGLGALLFGIRQSEQHEKDLRFCEIKDKIKFLINIAHLEDVIEVYTTESEALDAFEKDIQEDNDL